MNKTVFFPKDKSGTDLTIPEMEGQVGLCGIQTKNLEAGALAPPPTVLGTVA